MLQSNFTLQSDSMSLAAFQHLSSAVSFKAKTCEPTPWCIWCNTYMFWSLFSLSGHFEVQYILDVGCGSVSVTSSHLVCFLRKLLMQHNWRISVCVWDKEAAEREGFHLHTRQTAGVCLCVCGKLSNPLPFFLWALKEIWSFVSVLVSVTPTSRPTKDSILTKTLKPPHIHTGCFSMSSTLAW